MVLYSALFFVVECIFSILCLADVDADLFFRVLILYYVHPSVCGGVYLVCGGVYRYGFS